MRFLTPSTRKDMRKALWCSWLALACVSGVLAFAPYLIAQSTFAQWVGICPARAAGDPCSLCGMTTAFYLITGGQFDAATATNAASVPLYSGLVINFAAGVLETATRWRRSGRS
jgi:hypothetical protein